MKRNDLLKAAFEEAAEKELKSLPGEGDIVRPYSKEFKRKWIIFSMRWDKIRQHL